jgi:hypothetical protein
MRDQRYNLDSSESYTVFEFVSEGAKGEIKKIIKFTEMGEDNVYNLGFGDKSDDTKDFDDKVVSNNKDTTRVLATVSASVFIFTENYPESWIFATGSTSARTRLYRIGISNFLDEIEEDFIVFGLLNEEWLIFEKNVDYKAFLITRKSNLI